MLNTAKISDNQKILHVELENPVHLPLLATRTWSEDAHNSVKYLFGYGEGLIVQVTLRFGVVAGLPCTDDSLKEDRVGDFTSLVWPFQAYRECVMEECDEFEFYCVWDSRHSPFRNHDDCIVLNRDVDDDGHPWIECMTGKKTLTTPKGVIDMVDPTNPWQVLFNQLDDWYKQNK